MAEEVEEEQKKGGLIKIIMLVSVLDISYLVENRSLTLLQKLIKL